MVSIGPRQHSPDAAVALVEAFLAEPFSHDPRHQRRIDMLTAYEGDHVPPPLSVGQGSASDS